MFYNIYINIIKSYLNLIQIQISYRQKWTSIKQKIPIRNLIEMSKIYRDVFSNLKKQMRALWSE